MGTEEVPHYPDTSAAGDPTDEVQGSVRRLTQEEAARLLGGCERTFRRYADRYEDEGHDGLVDKRLGEVSARRAPVRHVRPTGILDLRTVR